MCEINIDGRIYVKFGTMILYESGHVMSSLKFGVWRH